MKTGRGVAVFELFKFLQRHHQRRVIGGFLILHLLATDGLVAGIRLRGWFGLGALL